MAIDWMRKVHQLEYANRYASLFWARLSRPIEFLALAIATVVAFSYQFPRISAAEYAELTPVLRQEVFVPLASLIVALLTAITAFVRPQDKAETYRRAAEGYEKLRHDLELILTEDPAASDAPAALKAWKSRWESLDAPNVGPTFFLRGKQKVTSLSKYPVELGFLEDPDAK
jgi:hypothetical protein